LPGNRKICFLAITVLAALLALSQTGQQYGTNTDTRRGEEKFIRLHVIANSDKPPDQELKLRVKDAVSSTLENLLACAQNLEEARQAVYQNLPVIEEIARKEVAAAGQDYGVKAEMGTFSFPHKNYGSFILPAGDYEAVRVVIGSGRGANWWCVLFPPLCFIDSKTAQALARAEAPAADKDPSCSSDAAGYEFRFRSLEIIEQLKNKQNGGF